MRRTTAPHVHVHGWFVVFSAKLRVDAEVGTIEEEEDGSLIPPFPLQQAPTSFSPTIQSMLGPCSVMSSLPLSLSGKSIQQ